MKEERVGLIRDDWIDPDLRVIETSRQNLLDLSGEDKIAFAAFEKKLF